MKLITLLLFSCLIVVGFSQSKPIPYVLTKTKKNAAVNADALDSIDYSGNTIKTMLKSFNPVKGKNTYYRFEASYMGDSYEGSRKEFHDILVLEVNEAGEIVKAYQYTKEWAEAPCQYDVFRSINPNIKLQDGMSILDLKLIRTMLNWDDEPIFEAFNEPGLLLMNPD